MKLLTQPGDGIAALLAGIKGAKKTIDIAIFRFDRAEIEAALKAAVGRGVSVNALIAYTNRGGELNLRKLEMRLLEVGVTVSRTAGDLLRYHDKMMIVDRSLLFVLSFNFTHLDIDHSRGFGVITRNARLVKEAVSLFQADTARTPYIATLDTFVVSPINARKVLGAFIAKARKELLIYDPMISDPEMLRALNKRAKAGVVIKVIGSIGVKNSTLDVKGLADMRLHSRTIIRDRREAFLGSQSLRQPELDLRREVGVVVRHAAAVSSLAKTFDADWLREPTTIEAKPRALKKAGKNLMKELSPLSPIVKEAIQDAMDSGSVGLNARELKETVTDAVKEAVRERVKELVKDAVEQG
ncbi:MAG TPA: phospholipase D-like domain-containing protein [Bryobacteraceae bacterium]|nr:phospholipase D-like domain-containing protein [Bryobacteraceae bacterium]